jgi:predicted DNA-binding transcriptional regulator YafY
LSRTTAATSTIRLKRIFKIHHLLRTMQPHSAEKLAAFCLETDPNANARLIRGDIGLLRELGAPIPRGNKHAKFRYEKAFSLLETLEGVDTADTDEVLSYLNQLYQKAPKAAFLELDKVYLALEQRIRTADALGDPRLQFERVAYEGQRYVSVLFDFVLNQRTIVFGYQPFGKPPGERTVFPVFLKEYNHRWFLIGFDQEVRAYQNYALDRIMSRPRLSDWKPVAEQLPDAATYFQHLIGVSLEGELKEVVVRVWKRRAWYVRTKPWHSTQTEVEETGEWIAFRWKVLLNRELRTRVLELGADAEVLSPPELRQEIAGLLHQAAARYVWTSAV